MTAQTLEKAIKTLDNCPFCNGKCMLSNFYDRPTISAVHCLECGATVTWYCDADRTSQKFNIRQYTAYKLLHRKNPQGGE